MLFRNVIGIVYKLVFFGRGIGRVVMFWVNCNGLEVSFLICLVDMIGGVNCDYLCDVGVFCLGKIYVFSIFNIIIVYVLVYCFEMIFL